MVLFLFVIMLLNLGHELQRDLKGGVFAVISAAIAGAMAGVLALQLRGSGIASTGAGADAIAAATAEYGAVGAIARPLYTTYVVPFEITGILLLVAVVGAVVLAKRSDA
jgi:NADH-quinone oxidoreductase subunit J